MREGPTNKSMWKICWHSTARAWFRDTSLARWVGEEKDWIHEMERKPPEKDQWKIALF